MNKMLRRLSASKPVAGAGQTLFNFTVPDAEDNPVELKSYEGKGTKAFLIVNVASLTDQNYKELVQLYGKYKNHGLEIMAFPCNQFGGQEPGDNEAIQAFAKGYGVTFPVFGKIKVNDSKAHPLYKWLKGALKGFITDSIKWNFSKFLLDGSGQPVRRFGPKDSPLSMEKDILKLLEDVSGSGSGGEEEGGEDSKPSPEQNQQGAASAASSSST